MHESAFSQVDFSQAALEQDKKLSSQATINLALCYAWKSNLTNEGQGQDSERKGVSPPSSSPDLDLEPLPTVPLRRSDHLKDKNLTGNPVTCATPSQKKKSSASIGSCNCLLGQNNKRSTQQTTIAATNPLMR